jgi:hypothetical protein
MTTLDVAVGPTRVARQRDMLAEAVPLLDQPVASASNFALNSMVARVSSPASFASFTIASTAYVVAQGALRGGLHLRMLARGAGEEAAPRLLWTVCVVATVLALLTAPLFLMGHAVAAALVCLALPIVLLQDAQRFVAFVTRRDVEALGADLAWFLATVALALAWRALVGSITPAVVTSMWMAGAAIAVCSLTAPRYRPRRHGVAVTSWSSRSTIAAGAGEFFVAASVTFGAPLLAALSFGSAGVASMRASLVFFAPCLALLPGVHTPTLRLLARVRPERRRRLQLALGLTIVVVVGAVLALMWSARGTLGPLMLGRLWHSTLFVIAPAACFTLARFIEVPVYGLARVSAPARTLLFLRVVTSVCILGAFVLAMVAGASLLTAYWTLAIASLVCAIATYGLRWRT